MRDRSHDDAVAGLFAKDPAFAVEFLNEVLSDGDQAELLVALRQLSKVHGGMAQVAERAELNPTQLYRALSPSGNPELRSLSAILRAMGLRLAVERVKEA
jgi:probable addiction module antidote protein